MEACNCSILFWIGSTTFFPIHLLFVLFSTPHLHPSKCPHPDTFRWTSSWKSSTMAWWLFHPIHPFWCLAVRKETWMDLHVYHKSRWRDKVNCFKKSIIANAHKRIRHGKNLKGVGGWECQVKVEDWNTIVLTCTRKVCSMFVSGIGAPCKSCGLPWGEISLLQIYLNIKTNYNYIYSYSYSYICVCVCVVWEFYTKVKNWSRKYLPWFCLLVKMMVEEVFVRSIPSN